MDVAKLIKSKGSLVVTITPEATISSLCKLLAEHKIGAVVVSADQKTVAGIVSERDVVRHAHVSGLLQDPVRDIMTTEVYTAEPDDSLIELATLMTDHRIRHVPVVQDKQLVGIISIGDVVKYRIEQLTAERDHLEGYMYQ